MTCEACRAACTHENTKERAVRVHRAEQELCGCENYSVSSFSPGRVKDEELLHMLISDPQHLLDGKLNPSSLIQVDRGGLSTLRDSADDKEFESTCSSLQRRATDKGHVWFLHAICTIPVSELRYLEDKRFVCVYDTGLPDKPHHADIMGPDLKSVATRPMSNGEVERACRARIKILIEKCGAKLVAPRVFRDGAFSGYARA